MMRIMRAHLVLASSRTLAGCRTGSDLLGMLGVARWGVRGVPGVICQTGNRQRRRGETQKQRADRLRFGGFRDFYLLVGSFSWRSGRGASFLLRARSARPGRSMSALFQHNLLVTLQRCLVLVTVVLAAALQLLLGGNKLVLVLSVWVQVLLVLQKIPDQTDSEAQNSETFWISQLITHDVVMLTAVFWCETTPAGPTSSSSSSVWWWPATSESFHDPLQPCTSITHPQREEELF